MTELAIDMSKETKFWDKVAEKYAARPVADQTAYERTLERVRAHLRSSDRVLEIGCGTGTTALKLASGAGSILATDLSPAMIDIAKRKRDDANASNVDFAVSTVFDKALEKERFDTVLAFNLFHLLEQPEAAMLRVGELLKPGGLFISKTACIGGKAWLFGPMIALMRLFGRAPKVRFFSVAEYDAMVEKAGFEIIETGVFPVSSQSRFVVARKRAGSRD